MSWPHALIQALQSSNLRVGLGNKKKAFPLSFSGHSSSGQHWPKQQWRDPHFFLPSVIMCQHCSHCVVAQLARPFSRSCVFHVLFYSERQMQLMATVIDRQQGCVCSFILAKFIDLDLFVPLSIALTLSECHKVSEKQTLLGKFSS